MPVNPDLLAILVCPDTHRSLRMMDADALKRLNGRIEKGVVRKRNGDPVEKTLQEALVREGDDLAYPVEDDIPVLLVEEGIPLD